MTPEETKEHVQRRLSELGWHVHIGRAGYEKIFRATGGAENETNRICRKLVSLVAAGPSREITDATVEIAVTDAAPDDEQPRRRRANGAEETDRAAIERLAAILDAKLKSQETRPAPVPPLRSASGEPDASQDRRLPKALVVQAADAARSSTAEALTRDFRVLQAAEGEHAWSMLLEHPDVGVVVVEQALAEADGGALARRMRGPQGPEQLARVPVVVLSESGDDAGDGANAVVAPTADARELRARILASYKASRPPAYESRRTREPRPRRPADVLFADNRYPRTAARERSGRFASTLMVTLIATALLALALAATFYVSRNPEALGLPRDAPAQEQAADAEARPDEPARAGTEVAPAPPDPAEAKATDASRAGRRQSTANASRAPPDAAAGAERRTAAQAAGPVPEPPRASTDEPALAPLALAGESGAPDGSASRSPAETSESAGGENADDTRPLWERLEQETSAVAQDAGDRPTAAPVPEAPAATSREEASVDTDRPQTGSERASPRAPAAAEAPSDSEPSADAPAESGLNAESAQSAVPNVAPQPPKGRSQVEHDSLPSSAALSDEEAGSSARAPSAEQAQTPPTPAPSAPAREEPGTAQPPSEAGREPARAAQPRSGSDREPAASQRSSRSNQEAATGTASPPSGEPPASASRPPAPSGPEPEVSDAAPAPQPRDEHPASPAPPAAEPSTQVARARPPQAPAPRSEPARQISRDELVSLVQRFASVYEAGDLEQFLSLFAEHARTNDRSGRDGIRRDYQALFGSTDLREMNLGQLSWEVDGNQAYGWGTFDVKVRRQRDREQFAYTGSLTLVVEKADGRLRIVRLFHGQQRAGR